MRQLWDIAIGQSLGNVVFVDSMWRFLEGPVVSLVSDDYFQQVEAYWPEDENSYIYGNRRMGNVRLRQVRVQTAGCQPTQTQFIQQDSSLPPMCYPQYDLSSDEGNSDYVWKNNTYTRSQSTVIDSSHDPHAPLEECPLGVSHFPTWFLALSLCLFMSVLSFF
jgi:hypothetical protein